MPRMDLLVNFAEEPIRWRHGTRFLSDAGHPTTFGQPCDGIAKQIWFLLVSERRSGYPAEQPQLPHRGRYVMPLYTLYIYTYRAP